MYAAHWQTWTNEHGIRSVFDLSSGIVVQCTKDIHVAYPNFSTGHTTTLRITTGGDAHWADVN